MLTMETFVKLCSIMVMDALISGMWTSVASGSGQSHAKLGMNKKESRPWSLVTIFAGWLL